MGRQERQTVRKGTNYIISVTIRAVKNIREGDVISIIASSVRSTAPACPNKALPWVGREDLFEEVTFEGTPEGYEGTRHVQICVTGWRREAWRFGGWAGSQGPARAVSHGHREDWVPV